MLLEMEGAQGREEVLEGREGVQRREEALQGRVRVQGMEAVQGREGLLQVRKGWVLEGKGRGTGQLRGAGQCRGVAGQSKSAVRQQESHGLKVSGYVPARGTTTAPVALFQYQSEQDGRASPWAVPWGVPGAVALPGPGHRSRNPPAASARSTSSPGTGATERTGRRSSGSRA